MTSHEGFVRDGAGPAYVKTLRDTIHGSASCVNGSPRRVFDVNIMLVEEMVSYLTRGGEEPEIGGAGHRVRGSEG